MPSLSANDIKDIFSNMDIDKASKDYVNFHKFRYQYLLQIINKYIEENKLNRPLKILDIGPAFQTYLIRNVFPKMHVNTLGFNNFINDLRDNETHYRQDLNEVDKNWNDAITQHDIILFCEVVEHLYTPPLIILARLNAILSDDGIIIIQTPNAIAVHKRILMAFGNNPYPLLQKDKQGHFREYTGSELKAILEQSKLKIKEIKYKNYFNHDRSWYDRIFVKLENFLPNSWRDGMTIVAKSK